MPQAQGPISFFTLTTETTRAISAYTVYNNSILFPGKIVSGTSTTKTKVLRLRLKDKHALEKLRDHRQKLANGMNELQSKSEFNSSLLMGTIATELGVIEAALEQFRDN